MIFIWTMENSDCSFCIHPSEYKHLLFCFVSNGCTHFELFYRMKKKRTSARIIFVALHGKWSCKDWHSFNYFNWFRITPIDVYIKIVKIQWNQIDTWRMLMENFVYAHSIWNGFLFFFSRSLSNRSFDCGRVFVTILLDFLELNTKKKHFHSVFFCYCQWNACTRMYCKEFYSFGISWYTGM